MRFRRRAPRVHLCVACERRVLLVQVLGRGVFEDFAFPLSSAVVHLDGRDAAVADLPRSMLCCCIASHSYEFRNQAFYRSTADGFAMSFVVLKLDALKRTAMSPVREWYAQSYCYHFAQATRVTTQWRPSTEREHPKTRADER